MVKQITVTAPGKLMLSGEWSVLENSMPCIVLAIDKKVSATIAEAKETSVFLKTHKIRSTATLEGARVIFGNQDQKLSFTRHAVEAALRYVEGKKIALKNFWLETESVGTNEGEHKLGFGSSAAAVVSISGAVLKLHGIGISTHEEKERLFKLGVIAHYLAQGKIGSGFDIAASVFGGAIEYKRFDANWLEAQLKHKGVYEITEEKWPLFAHRSVKLPKGMEIVVGFTGKSASTRELVHKIHEFKEKRKLEYDRIIRAIKEVTERLELALEKGSKTPVLELLTQNRLLLKELGEFAGVELETVELEKIARIAQEHGAAGKFSGAGGGDCGIAVCFDKKVAAAIKKDFTKNGILVVETKIVKDGAKVD